MKGFGSGLGASFAGEAWEVAKGFDCVLWDGEARLWIGPHRFRFSLELWGFDALPNRRAEDWFKEDSFSSFIAEFLRASPAHHAVAVRKASGKLDGLLGSSGLLRCSCSFDLRNV